MIWDLRYIADPHKPKILVGSKHHNYEYAFNASSLSLYTLLDLHSPTRNIYVEAGTGKKRYWEAQDYFNAIDQFLKEMKEEQFKYSISETEISGRDYAELEMLLYQLVRDAYANMGLLDDIAKGHYVERPEVH